MADAYICYKLQLRKLWRCFPCLAAVATGFQLHKGFATLSIHLLGQRTLLGILSCNLTLRQLMRWQSSLCLKTVHQGAVDQIYTDTEADTPIHTHSHAHTPDHTLFTSSLDTELADVHHSMCREVSSLSHSQ